MAYDVFEYQVEEQVVRPPDWFLVVIVQQLDNIGVVNL